MTVCQKKNILEFEKQIYSGKNTGCINVGLDFIMSQEPEISHKGILIFYRSTM